MKITQSNYLEQVSEHNLLNLHPAIEEVHNFLAKATKGFTSWELINKTDKRKGLWENHVALIAKEYAKRDKVEIKSNPAVKQETKEKAERAVKTVKAKKASDPCEECAEKKDQSRSKSKPKSEGRKPKATKPKAAPKPKAPTKTELREQAKLGHYQKSKKVAHSPEEFTHIKTFIRLVSQSSKEKLIRALKALQKAITSEKIKGSSKWADIILKIQDAYLDILNAGKAPYDLKSSQEFLTKLADEINDYSIFKSVEMLNRFVGATEKELSESAYKSLRNAFIRAERYVKDSDPYASRFKEVLSALKKSETAKNFSFDTASLNGIQGLTIFRYAKPKKATTKRKAKAVKK